MSAPVSPIVAKAKVPLRLLLVEDNDDDALLLLRELDRGGYAVSCTRVDTLDGLHGALDADDWQLVVSDFSLPTMTAHDVLTLLGTSWPDLPCIVISGTITEEAASDVLRAGARDFIVKERMARLLPAIGRELKEAVERRQRRETEKTLQETRERMQFALDSVGIGTWETDVRTGRAIWSDVVERLHGLRPGTFGGTLEAFMTLVHADDRHAVLEHIARLRRDRRDSRIEYRTEWPDGSQHWILSIGRTFWDAHDEPERAVGVSLDITPQKRLEEQIRQSQKMESIGNLAGGIAHDFNNLLTVITGCCELAAESLPARSPAADPLDQIRSAAISAAGLTRQLLTFSRRQIVSPRLINLNTVVTAFASILRRLVEENIRIDFRLAPHLPFVRVDQGQMEQVLLNLVANGRDAMPDGGAISIESSHATVDADYDRIQPGLTPGPYVILAVSDNGSGMTPEVQARLFEPFFTTKPRGRGTGLGLSTVYGIVKQSGGHISVYSEPGIGTTFRIYLPVAQPDGAETPVIEEKAASKPVALTGRETVLVVEDNPLLRRLNEQILHQYGYKVLLAGDGAQAQRLCNDHDGPIHVVIMDVVMPGESGPVVGEWIAQQRTQTKIIYMSGYAGEGLDRSRILASGSVFLQKPFTGAQLARAIRDVLAP